MSVPPGYRSLLVAFPERWRRAHGDVVIQTLLELHEVQGRTRPSWLERLRFFGAGLRHQLPGAVVVSSRPLLVDDAPIRFDQTNGVTDITGDSIPRLDVSERNRRRLEASERAMMIVFMGDR